MVNEEKVKRSSACKTQQKSAFPAFFCEIQEKINL